MTGGISRRAVTDPVMITIPFGEHRYGSQHTLQILRGIRAHPPHSLKLVSMKLDFSNQYVKKKVINFILLR